MTSNIAYVSGFCKTAEQCGVDPSLLMKVAFDSTPVNEVALGALPMLIPGVGRLGAAVGSMSGQIAEPSEEQKDGLLNLLPGVASHRLSNRLKTQVLEQYRRHGVDGMGQLTAENIGSITPSLLLAGVGAGIGRAIAHGKSDKKKTKATVTGALTGFAVPQLANLVGAIAAGIRRRRTEKEQVEHDIDRSNITKDLLIPGVGAYNKLKRLGRSQGDRDKRSKNSKKN